MWQLYVKQRSKSSFKSIREAAASILYAERKLFVLRKFGVTKSQEILLLIGIILIIANEAGPHISLVNFQACLTRDRWVHFVFLEISFIKLNCIKVFIDKLKKKTKNC